MRIALVTRRYWPAVGGIERVVIELGRALRALGHEIEIVAQRVDEGETGWLTHTVLEAPEFAPFEHDGIPVRQFRLPLGRRALLAPLAHEAIPRLPRLTRGGTRKVTGPWYGHVAGPALAPLLKSAQVVHVLGGAWVSVAGVAAARALGLPVAVTPFVHRGFWRDDPASVRSYRQTDTVLATVEADAEALRSLGVPDDKIEVCGLPVPAAADGVSRPERPPIVLFVGARVPHKGIDELRAAARRVWTIEPEARFAYVGPGERLRDADPRELDIGPVSDGERGTWLERATLLCLPSSTESFGLVVAESWSVRRPVVTSGIPVLRELVERSGGGFAVPRDPGAIAVAIVELLTDHGLADRMGGSGFEHWKREYEPEAAAERHLAIYAAIRERRRPS